MPILNELKVERRSYPRVKVPVLYRPAKSDEPVQPTLNMSPGGLRVHSNVYFTMGHQMEIELLLTDGQTIVATVRVVWVHVLPAGSEALFDMGFKFIHLSPEMIEKLKIVLEGDSFEEEI